MALTRTQLDALAHLHKTGMQWPLMAPRYGGDRHTATTRFSRRVLHALVVAGLALWARPCSGVMPHVVPRDRAGLGDGYVNLPPEHGADVARVILTGALWRQYPQAYIDGDRVRRVRSTLSSPGTYNTWMEV